MKKLLSVVLVFAMLLSSLAPFALAQELDNNIGYSKLLSSAAEAETDNRVWFDLNGNSRFFVKSGEETYTSRNTYKDYLPGVDFAGFVAAPTGDFAIDQAAVKTPPFGGAMFLYQIGEPKDTHDRWTTPVFTKVTDDSNYWTIKGVSYLIKPKENVIKVSKNAIDTSNLTDAAKIARYKSINEEAIIDVADGQYKSVGLLAGITAGDSRNATVTLVYSDTSKEERITIKTVAMTEAESYKTGTIYLKNFTNSNDNSNGSHGFVPVTIETDPTKTLTAIKIKDATLSSTALCILVVSAWGEKADTDDFVSLIEEIMADGISSLDEYNSVKAYMNFINEEELTDEQKAVYNNTLSAIAAFEANLEEMQQEAARQEAMTKRTHNYLTISANKDVFVTWKDVTDLARFQYNAAGTSTSVPEGFNTATYDYNGTTIFEWIPHERADGTPVTGKETFYYKGFKNVAITTLSENEDERGNAPAVSSYAYLIDDIYGENGTSVVGRKVAGIASGKPKNEADVDTSIFGADEYYAGLGGVERSTTDNKKTVKNPNFIQEPDENGYFIISNNDKLHKIGPVLEEGYAPNAQILGTSKGSKIENVNVKGSTLDVLITTATLNVASGYTTTKLAVGATPNAALQQVTVKYKDGTEDTKYVLATRNVNTTSAAANTIVFAPKYEEDGVTEIKYDENSFYLDAANHSFTKLSSSNCSTIELSSIDDANSSTIKFKNPDIIMSDNATLAQMILLRQDGCQNNYGNSSTLASIPLDYKEIDTIVFPYNADAAVNDPTSIVIKNNTTSTTAPSLALLPLEIEGASDEYVYFAYCSRIANDSYLMAATVTENSSNEKIAAAHEAMSKITAESTFEEAKEALELYNVAKADTYLKESDFDSSIVDTFMNTYTTIRENIKLSGKISVKYYNGEKPSADVEMYNYAELAGKTYKVILAYYDENGIYLGSDVFDKATTEAEKEAFTVKGEKCPENAAKVKGFIWKDYDKLIPLAEPDETEKKSTFKILSIGNSYSQNAHSHLVKIAADAGFEKVQIANLFIGGCRIEKHYNNAVANNPEYTYQYQELNADGTVKRVNTSGTTMLDGIKAEDWDIITIQQQSLDSGVETTYVKEQIDYLVDYINTHKTNKDAKVVWHMTWPYATDYTGNTLYGTYFDYKQDAMYQGILSAVKTHIAPRNDFDYIIPAGTAIQNARLLNLDEEELSEDGTHLNDLGCYIIGLTWFAKITGMSIDNITYMPVGDSADLPAIKTAVKNAIANPYAVTK